MYAGTSQPQVIVHIESLMETHHWGHLHITLGSRLSSWRGYRLPQMHLPLRNLSYGADYLYYSRDATWGMGDQWAMENNTQEGGCTRQLWTGTTQEEGVWSCHGSECHKSKIYSTWRFYVFSLSHSHIYICSHIYTYSWNNDIYNYLYTYPLGNRINYVSQQLSRCPLSKLPWSECNVRWKETTLLWN